MGRITSKTSTRWWSKSEITFLKTHRFTKRTEIARLMGRNHSGVCAKMRALGIPKRQCDEVKLTHRQKQLIFGSLLGDGTIAQGKSDKNPRFSEGHSIKQKSYLLFKYKALKPFSGKFIEYNTKWGGEVKFSTYNHPEFVPFRKMFYDYAGRKMIKRCTLFKITHPLALAMWFGDDGSKEKDSYRLATGAYNVQELNDMIHWLKKVFRIRSYLHKHGKYYYLSIREDRSLFSKVIKPYLPKCMYYKLFLTP